MLTYRGSVTQCQNSFYFVNTPDGGFPEPPYPLTYGPRPAEIPKELQLLYYSYPGGVSDPYYITMPDSAWFSAPIPIHFFGSPENCYFYLWMSSCGANVMLMVTGIGGGYDTGADKTKGAGNGVITYVQRHCTPFEMVDNLVESPADVTGTHGGDDLDPAVVGASLGGFTNPRIGR